MVCATRFGPPSTCPIRFTCGDSRESWSRRASLRSLIVQDARVQVATVNASQQLVAPRDLVTQIHDSPEYATQRLIATLFGIFSFLALALAVVGLYSVVSYAVATRTNEFGIRLALGAKAADLFRLVLSATTASVATGLFVGLALSRAFTKLSPPGSTSLRATHLLSQW